MQFETKAIHAGYKPDPTTGAITPPIYQTATYVLPELGVNLGYDTLGLRIPHVRF